MLREGAWSSVKPSRSTHPPRVSIPKLGRGKNSRLATGLPLPILSITIDRCFTCVLKSSRLFRVASSCSKRS